MITGFTAVVKTTATSAGAATLAAGLTGTANLFLTATPVASLTANAVFGENGAFDQAVRLPSGANLTMTIGTAALTAGRVEFTFKVQRI